MVVVPLVVFFYDCLLVRVFFWRSAGENPIERSLFFFKEARGYTGDFSREREKEEKKIFFFFFLLSRTGRPRVGRHHPPNLSISLSGGEETNWDPLGNGERRGESSGP